MRTRQQLLHLLAGDLPGLELDPRAPGSATLETPEGLRVGVSEKVEKRFLGRTVVALFTNRLPGLSPTGSASLGRAGKRQSQRIVVEGGQGISPNLASEIEASDVLLETLGDLDYKRVDVSAADRDWIVTVELMGASLVAIAFPPIRSYIRLYPDQRDGLLRLFRELGAILQRH